MRKSVLAMILAGGEGSRLYPLTRDRAKPAVPFGGKYRIVDFVLSNFVNSGITSIFVLTQFRSQSLVEHIINGWNISSGQKGKNQFILTVPAQMQTEDRRWYSGTADAISQNIDLIEDFNPELVAVFGADHIYRMDLTQIVDFHIDNNAIATISAIPVPIEEADQFGIIEVDEEWRITGFQEKPKENPATIPGDPTHCLASMGNYIFNHIDLLSLLKKDNSDQCSSHDFGRDILPPLVETGRLFAYNYMENKIPGQTGQPYWRDVGTLKAYFEANMDLREKEPQLDLYNTLWPIYNYNESLPPAKFVHNEEVGPEGLPRIGKAISSIICDGSIISGATVTNSIISNSVYVHSYATVNNCIIFSGVDIGEHCRIRNAIIDKHNTFPNGTVIGYDRAEDSRRYTVVDLDEKEGTWLTIISKQQKKRIHQNH